MADIDWEEINAKLPYARTEDDFGARKEMWDGIDVNANGYVSLAEVTKGVRDVIAVEDLFDCIPAINRSFHYCKGISGEGNFGEEFLEFREFRTFLQTLRMFFEFYQCFQKIDTGDDSRINKDEFTSAQETIEKWVGPIEDMEAEFDSIDVNEGGEVLFSEFVDWALPKDLDVEDDVDPAE